MIKIGTCGFSFKDWKGTVYPENIKDRDILPFYNKTLGMDIVEIDVSYYQLLPQNVAESWNSKTDRDFLFTIKCHKDITLNEMGKVDPLALNNGDVFDKFLYSYTPIINNNKLLTFLAQFGPAFNKNKKNVQYLSLLKEKFKSLPLTIEFRHKSWLEKENREDTFTHLRRLNLGYAVVDEPQVRSLAPFILNNTNPVGYFRFHGRNRDWFTATGDERYNYEYSDDELREFIPFIKELEKRTAVTTVFFNNCHSGAALKNSVKLRQMLGIAGYNANLTGHQLKFPF
ncbi:MAG: DUF72 domain-containing protein [Vulcanimicrobiota bacterium]